MKVYILCGLMGAGKSYEAKRLASLEKSFIVNVDNLRSMFYAKYFYDDSDESLIRDIFDRLLMGLLLNNQNNDFKAIIIDEANYILTKENRKELVNTIKEIKNDAEIIFVICPEKERNIERRIQENRGLSNELWKSVFERMVNEYQDITDEECQELNVIKQFKVETDFYNTESF